MTRGALLTLGLIFCTHASAQNLSYDDILALDPSDSPRRAALKTAPATPAAPLPLPSRSSTASAASWGYDGETAPAHWHTLHTDYASCAGDNQSPIDIQTAFDTQLDPIAFHYTASAQSVSNDGNAVRFTYPTSKHIIVDGEVFYLRQLDIHTPSENRINGESFPLEAHLTHESLDGNIAVVAVMGSLGDDNPALAPMVQAIPAQAGQHAELAKLIEPHAILPANREYFRFNGSLTTPPCTEGVRWFVLKEAVPVSTAQLQTVAGALAHANNRPVQPLNARVVLK